MATLLGLDPNDAVKRVKAPAGMLVAGAVAVVVVVLVVVVDVVVVMVEVVVGTDVGPEAPGWH